MIVARAIDGPNGMGVLLSFFKRISINIETINPIPAARMNVRIVLPTPKVIPSKKNNLISPPPIPPFEMNAIKNKMRNPRVAPSILSHHIVSGDIMRPTMNKGKKNSNTLFGIIMYNTSDTVIMTSKEINTHITINS